MLTVLYTLSMYWFLAVSEELRCRRVCSIQYENINAAKLINSFVHNLSAVVLFCHISDDRVHIRGVLLTLLLGLCKFFGCASSYHNPA